MPKKDIHMHTKMDDLSTKKKETVICSNVDLKGITLSEMSQTKREKSFMVSLLCEIFIKVKYIEAESRTVAIGDREVGRQG